MSARSKLAVGVLNDSHGIISLCGSLKGAAMATQVKFSIMTMAITLLAVSLIQCDSKSRNKIKNTPIQSEISLEKHKKLNLESLNNGVIEYKQYDAIHGTCEIYSICDYGVMDIGMLRIAKKYSSFEGYSLHHIRLWDELKKHESMISSESSGFTGYGNNKVTIKTKGSYNWVDFAGFQFVIDKGIFKYNTYMIDVLHKPTLIIVDEDLSTIDVVSLPDKCRPISANVISKTAYPNIRPGKSGVSGNDGQDKKDSNEPEGSVE